MFPPTGDARRHRRPKYSQGTAKSHQRTFQTLPVFMLMYGSVRRAHPPPVRPLARLLAQVSLANSERFSGGVAGIISTAAGRSSADCLHGKNGREPLAQAGRALRGGVIWRVRRPMPMRFKTTPRRVLQALQFQRRLSGAVFSSNPSRWPTSTLRRLPQNAQIGWPGGGSGWHDTGGHGL